MTPVSVRTAPQQIPGKFWTRPKIVGFCLGGGVLLVLIILLAILSGPGTEPLQADAKKGGTIQVPNKERIVPELNLVELYREHRANPIRAEQKYKGKSFQFTGNVGHIGRHPLYDQPTLFLGNSQADDVLYKEAKIHIQGGAGVMCFSLNVAQFDKGQRITVRGTFLEMDKGIDPIPILNNCVLVKD